MVVQSTEVRASAENLAVGRNWFAVLTSTHHEKRVSQYLAQRDIECFLPVYSTVRRWRNRCNVKLELPLFPNYLFVHIRRDERIRVLQVQGVRSIVGSGLAPVPLPEFEIESLRSGMGARYIEPHPYLIIGKRVRIKSGALAGLEGVLVRKKNSLRVVLTLDQIMKSIAVEVDSEEVEPLRLQ